MKQAGLSLFFFLLLIFPVTSGAKTLVCPNPSTSIEENKNEARRYYNLGNTHFNMEQYEKSAEAFSCVIQLVPYTVIARFRLAVSYDRLGKLDLALEHYRWILADASDEAAPLQPEARTRVDEIRKQIDEKNAAVKAEADKKAKAEADRKAKEDARLKVEADKKAKAEADRKAKEDARLKAEADKKAQAGAGNVIPPDTTVPRLTSQWWFWTGVGATALLAATTAGMGILAMGERDKYEEGTSADENIANKYNRYLLFGDIALAGTLVSAAALGAAIWLWKPSKKSDTTTTGVFLVPSCGPEGCMMTLTLGF